MVSLASLWLPILVSAVVVFVASSIVHMVLKYHQSDYGQLPNEDEIMADLRKYSIPPGDYAMPYCEDMKDMAAPAYVEKTTLGPNMLLMVAPNGQPSMGKNLAQWFVFSIVVSVFAAYVAAHTLEAGVEYLDVFRITGTVAFAGYGLGILQGSIWYGKGWSATLKSVLDGFIYAMLTAGVMSWLWP